MPHSMMMFMPEAFGPKYHMSIDKRAFYEYHAALLDAGTSVSSLLSHTAPPPRNQAPAVPEEVGEAEMVEAPAAVAADPAWASADPTPPAPPR